MTVPICRGIILSGSVQVESKECMGLSSLGTTLCWSVVVPGVMATLSDVAWGGGGQDVAE